MKSATPKPILLRSRLMRRHPTNSEQILWSRLRDRQLGGAKFRRQHPVGPFIVDFYCHEANLAIEVDGGGHVETLQANYDSERTAELESREIRVLRFWNNEIFENIEGVLEAILRALEGTDPEKKRCI